MDESSFSGQLERLDVTARTAFAAACAERLQLVYMRWARLTEHEDPVALSAILSDLWDDLTSPRPDDEIDRLIDTGIELIPDDDYLPSLEEQAGADDASAAVVYALRCRRTGSVQDAVWAARRAYETLERYVIDTEQLDLNAPKLRERVNAHELVQAELLRQARDLDELLRDAISIKQLRSRSQGEALAFLPVSETS